MMLPTSPARDQQLCRLLFLCAFSDSVDTGSLIGALGDGLVDRRGVGRVRALVVHVQRLQRTYAGLDGAARERLGQTRYARRAAFARGVLSMEAPA